MPRPPKTRLVRHEPEVVHFKPAGVPMRLLEEVSLGHDELEAMRLADLEGLSHEQVGEMMNVSRATAGRILAEARRKTAAALVHGGAVRGGLLGRHSRVAVDRARADGALRVRPAAREVV